MILDSSMLMLPLEKRINLSFELERIITSSFEIVVPQIVLNELTTLSEKGKPSIKQKALLAIKLANNFKILDSDIEGNADLEIERLAEEYQAIVATNDAELRSKLRKKGLAVISLRGKNQLAFFGFEDY
ncbi:MAG: PIN domain-containing protein [Candidatus Heimdallarchaeota archaeon]